MTLIVESMRNDSYNAMIASSGLNEGHAEPSVSSAYRGQIIQMGLWTGFVSNLSCEEPALR